MGLTPRDEDGRCRGLGRCDLPAYAEHCERIRVARDLAGLELIANEMAGNLIGR